MIMFSAILSALLVSEFASTYHLNGGNINFGNLTKNEIIINDEDSWEQDPFVAEANAQCAAGETFACLKSTAAETISSLFTRPSYPVAREARFVRTKPYTKERLFPEDFNITSPPSIDTKDGRRSILEGSVWGSVVDFLVRRAETFVKTTAFEVELTEELTGGGEYAPRFLDEIYTEIDALEDKNDKPNKRYEFKKLFIPLLFMLKVFKVKLLVLLPIIFGLVSFKKVLAFLAIIVPGIIGYYRVCKPDLGQSYGSFGHSNYYHGPPSIQQKIHEAQVDKNDWANHGYSGGEGTKDKSPYRGYSRYAPVEA